MATTGIRISHYAPLDLGIGTSGALSDVPLANTLSKLLSAPGAKGVSGLVVYTSPNEFVAANACLEFVSTSGTIGGVINGVSVTFASTGNDTDDATAMLGAIFGSVDPLVSGIIAGTNLFGSLVPTSVVAGDSFVVGGCRFVAVAQGTTNLLPGQFAIGATDADTAVNIATAIRRVGQLTFLISPTVVGSAVYIFAQDANTVYEIFSNSSTIAALPMSLGRLIQIHPFFPGALGNCVTLAATGTGVTAVGTTSGRLSNGSAFTGITATTF